MKKKIVIKLQPKCNRCRSQAMGIAVVAEGVTSVTLEGQCRDQMVVIGEDVDAAALTCSLRKKTGYANIESVEEVKEKAEEKKPEKKEVEEVKKDAKPSAVITYVPTCPQPPYTVVYDTYPSNDACTIM